MSKTNSKEWTVCNVSEGQTVASGQRVQAASNGEWSGVSRRRNHMSTESHVDEITCRHQTAEVGNVPLRMDLGARECVVPEVLECGMPVYVFAVFAVFACGCCLLVVARMGCGCCI